MRIVFLHGLEGSPNGIKPRTLRAMPGAEVTAPALPVASLMEWRAKVVEEGSPPPLEVLTPCLEVARAAVRDAAPELVVGSSFGAGLASRLAVEGTWAGPMVLLAPAARRLFGSVVLPKRAGAVVVVHARGDDVVPYADSEALVRSAACEVLLWAVDDDHRLTRFVEDGQLPRAVELAMR
ncbi:MAG: hypothetical protein U0228_33470 [Myxococcaceae bacterium]